jgi:CBS domain-containing protein
MVGQADSITNDHRVTDICLDLPLSVESAASVREAAIAIRFHGVNYLPIVDDSRLVGIVAFREERRQPRSRPDLWSDRYTAGRARARPSTPN